MMRRTASGSGYEKLRSDMACAVIAAAYLRARGYAMPRAVILALPSLMNYINSMFRSASVTDHMVVMAVGASSP
jgi:hypothetical protein